MKCKRKTCKKKVKMRYGIPLTYCSDKCHKKDGRRWGWKGY